MLFGLGNAAQRFQRFMDDVCRGLNFVFVYIDDVLIASEFLEEHLGHIKIILQRFKEYGVILNPDKCIFDKTCLDFLDF